MIELSASSERLPLQLLSRLLAAPGVWAPDSRLPLAGLGALVTPLLGWAWDGGAATWEARPGGLVWAPPRRPLERFAQRLAREAAQLPRIFTLAPDAPKAIERAMRALEADEAAGFVLWDATPDAIEAARREGAAGALLAEVPCTEAAGAQALVQAGADALWLGPPRVGEGPLRLWGPAVLPFMVAAVEACGGLGLPLVAGAGVGSTADALRLRAAGAEAIALDPAWWVQPGLAAEVGAALA